MMMNPPTIVLDARDVDWIRMTLIFAVAVLTLIALHLT